MQENLLIKTENIEIPDHEEKFKNIKSHMKILKAQLKNIERKKKLDIETYEKLMKNILDTLYYVGDLSMFIFNQEENIKKLYDKRYPKSPALATKLYDEFYHDLHRPYNNLKNLLHGMISQLDILYYKIIKTNPPKEIFEY